jgi:hypothetical protein
VLSASQHERYAPYPLTVTLHARYENIATRLLTRRPRSALRFDGLQRRYSPDDLDRRCALMGCSAAIRLTVSIGAAL